MVIGFDIAFDEGNESYKTSLKLLELDEEVVAALGQDLEAQFVSNSTALEAVLCTPTETFSLTKVESSNCALLVTGTGTVRSMFRFHWEAQRIRPRLKLKLSLPTYIEHARFGVRGPDVKHILASTQASPAEIELAIQSSTVIVDELGGHFYVQDSTLHQCLDQVLMIISLQGWSPCHIPLKACAEKAAKNGLDIGLVKYCLKRFSLSTSASGNISLDVRRIARVLTKSLFVTTEIYACVNDLVNDLRDCLPTQIEPVISWLDGIITISSEGSVSLSGRSGLAL